MVVVRFGHDWDAPCMQMDEVLAGVCAEGAGRGGGTVGRVFLSGLFVRFCQIGIFKSRKLQVSPNFTQKSPGTTGESQLLPGFCLWWHTHYFNGGEGGGSQSTLVLARTGRLPLSSNVSELLLVSQSAGMTALVLGPTKDGSNICACAHSFACVFVGCSYGSSRNTTQSRSLSH